VKETTMSKLATISDLDLATVTGGDSAGNANVLGGLVASGKYSHLSQQSANNEAVRQACTMANTAPNGRVNQQAAGQCMLDRMNLSIPSAAPAQK
jgi:hypothetical protein